MPLFFAFVLTLMPFGLLEHNQRQRAAIRHERELLQWEHRAGNYLQMFKSLWSVELQIKYRQFMLKKARLRAGLTKNFTGQRFLEDLRAVFPQELLPRTLYAGVYNQKTGLRMFSGAGFTVQKRRFFARILEKLIIASEDIQTSELASLNSMVRGAFGEVVDFDLLKNYRRGKVSRVMFEGDMNLLFWDTITATDGSILVSLQLFSPGNLDRLGLMQLVANSLSMKNPEICAVLMPLEFSGSGNVPVFDSYVPPEQKQRIQKLFEKMSGVPLARDRLVPAGKFVDYEGIRIFRDFIDYAVPFEVWVLSRENPTTELHEPALSFIMRLFFFSAWLLVFCKVLISGQPVGISLKNWLTMTFVVVGILPLLVFFVAGIFQIDSALFRREQQAIKDSLQRLEEADASGEVVLSEFRDAFRIWTREPEWVDNIVSWNPDSWKIAVSHIQKRFVAAGLTIGGVYIYPPDRAGLKSACFVLPGKENSEEAEMRTHEFYRSWVLKAYHKLVPELMEGAEPEMSVFQGRTGQEVLRIFLSNRGDTSFVDMEDEKQVFYHNYILLDGKPHNWYFFRFDVAGIFEDYLRKTVKSLQATHPENFYAVVFFDRNGTRLAFPEPGSREAGLIGSNAGYMIDLAAISRSQLIRHDDDKFVISYPCVKSGTPILINIVYFSAMRSAAHLQELLLAILVILMAVPVVIISRMTAGYLVTPLIQVESGLKKIADEDYSVKLQLNRDDEFGLMTASFDRMVEGLKERSNLGRFVSATLNQQVSRAENEDDAGLENRIGAVLCSDIRSFTSISEANQARDVVEMLNGHLAAMSECIREAGGLVEQFVGDAVLAVFHGSSMEIASANAVRAAVAMRRSHAQLCRRRQSEGKFVYETGIGIEVGILLSGIVSAGSRSDYTVVGAARNMAEELEAKSKEGRYTRIIVSPQVFSLVKGYKFIRHVDGKNYEVAELEAET